MRHKRIVSFPGTKGELLANQCLLGPSNQPALDQGERKRDDTVGGRGEDSRGEEGEWGGCVGCPRHEGELGYAVRPCTALFSLSLSVLSRTTHNLLEKNRYVCS